MKTIQLCTDLAILSALRAKLHLNNYVYGNNTILNHLYKSVPLGPGL